MSWLDDFYKKQDDYFASMIAAYNAGKLDENIAPYIRWKQGKGIISMEEGYTIMKFVNEELDRIYQSDSIDETVRDFYEGIYDEVSNLIVIGAIK